MAYSRRGGFGQSPNREIDDNSSQKVFLLRKEKNLSAAYDLAIKLYNENQNDGWVQKAYAWVLIDIVKLELIGNLDNACTFYEQLLAIKFVDVDEIISKQINYLRPKLDIQYQEISKLEILSKNQNHVDAIDGFINLYSQGRLAKQHHESFAWAIYRYLKAYDGKLTNDNVENLLFNYLSLENPRPELAHSMILQYAIFYSNKTPSFNMYDFFQQWNPTFLRDEDQKEDTKDGKTYPSLLAKLLRGFVKSNYVIDVESIQKSLNSSQHHNSFSAFGRTNVCNVIDLVRESCFWELINLHKSNDYNGLWNKFDFYINHYVNFGESEWHSKILEIAERYMQETNAWRFTDFFNKWNFNNFRTSDWKEHQNGDFLNKALALKSLKRVFEVAKLPNSKNKDFSWVLPIFELAFTQTESDVWLKREYAILLGLSGQKEKAISLYKKVILELSDKSYAWHELSTLVVQDIELAIAMLCKAILIEKDESYLGKIRLELAKHLISKEMLTEAKLELNKYIENVNSKGWKTSDEFSILNEKLSGVSVNETENNLDFYQQNITKVDDFIYFELPWVDLMLFDKWDADNGKTRLAFTSLNKTELVVNAHKFELIKHANLNDIFQFKLHHDEVNNKYSALKVQKSNSTKADFISNAPENIAVVDHINPNKELFHYVINSKSDGIVKFSNTTIRPKEGDFIKIKYFKTHNKKTNSYKTNVISIEPTNEINTSLVKSLTGRITLKYKFDGRTHDYEDAVSTKPEIDTNQPDFGFVADYYVPKFMLNKKSVYKDCEVAVKVLFNGEKWSVFDLQKI